MSDDINATCNNNNNGCFETIPLSSSSSADVTMKDEEKKTPVFPFTQIPNSSSSSAPASSSHNSLNTGFFSFGPFGPNTTTTSSLSSSLSALSLSGTGTSTFGSLSSSATAAANSRGVNVFSFGGTFGSSGSSTVPSLSSSSQTKNNIFCDVGARGGGGGGAFGSSTIGTCTPVSYPPLISLPGPGPGPGTASASVCEGPKVHSRTASFPRYVPTKEWLDIQDPATKQKRKVEHTTHNICLMGEYQGSSQEEIRYEYMKAQKGLPCTIEFGTSNPSSTTYGSGSALSSLSSSSMFGGFGTSSYGTGGLGTSVLSSGGGASTTTSSIGGFGSNSLSANAPSSSLVSSLGSGSGTTSSVPFHHVNPFTDPKLSQFIEESKERVKIVFNNARFMTSKSTLKKQVGLLSRIVNYYEAQGGGMDKQTVLELFFNRDGTRFQLILDHLNGRNIISDVMDMTEKDREMLWNDAAYFELQFLQLLKVNVNEEKQAREQRASTSSGNSN